MKLISPLPSTMAILTSSMLLTPLRRKIDFLRFILNTLAPRLEVPKYSGRFCKYLDD